MDIETNLKIEELLKSKNVAELLSDKDLSTISERVLHDYDLDLTSRSDWETRNAESLKLALQMVTEKTFPWPGCANVMYPLVTMAAMQCHAREYPALISGTDLVRCRSIGEDPDGLKSLRAQRVAAHMSYQLLEEDENWEGEMDRVLFTKAIVGTAFKKVYFNPVLGHNISEGVLAQDLVIPYKARSLEKASRITQKIEFSRNAIYEKVARGLFIDTQTEQMQQQRDSNSELESVSDQLQGHTNPEGDQDTPILVLEQHRYLDLDQDGYEEPYIVTVEKESRKIRRIVARFFADDIITKRVLGKTKILYIKPQQFFVKYGMIPSPDGGIYDIGFGSLLGPINKAANTVINQLLDAGTMASLGGGFLGRGAKLQRGQIKFSPGKWIQADGVGNDLKNSIVPLPVSQPSQVLFALLGMLIQSGERIVGTTEIMTGSSVGQNTPASTAQEMVKQGSVVFNSIFKRTYRSLKEEYRMLFRLNQLYIEVQQSFEELSTGNSAMIVPEDYLGPANAVRPSADPNISSVEKRMQQAMFLKQASLQGPGYDKLAVERRLLEAAQIPFMQEVWNPKNPAPQDPKVQLEQTKFELEKAKLQADMQYKMLKLMQEADKTRAEVLELQARAAKEMAEAQGVDAGHMISLINAEIAVKKNKQDGVFRSVEIMKDLMDSMFEKKQQEGDKGGAVPDQKQQLGDSSLAGAPGNERGMQLP